MIHFRASRALLLLAGSLSLLSGCKKDRDDPADDLFSTYDRRGMLTSLRDNVIRPAYADFATATATLETSAAALGTAADTTGLGRVRRDWRAATLAWARVLVYEFGPAETLSTAAGVAYAANPTIIENAITPTVTFTPQYLGNLGASAKGLNSLEYLLFSRAAGTDPVAAQLSNGANASQRRAFIAALAADVRRRADQVHQAWQSGNAATEFVEADGNDVTSSISLLTNAVVRQTENVKNMDLGLPLGDLNGGTAAPTAVPHYLSGVSREFIQQELLSLEATYAGNRAGAAPAPGFDDLLDHLGADSNGQRLSARISQQFAACQQQLTAISAPLDAAISTNPQPVRDLYNGAKQLTVLLKTDMVSRLGVLLTFNDNDGD